MPDYHYVLMDKSGSTRSGRTAAASEAELEAAFAAQGLWLIEATPGSAGKQATELPRHAGWTWGGVKRRDLIEAFAQLQFQLMAGIPVLTALEGTVADSENRRLRHIFESLRRGVESGNMLHECMRQFPRVFTPQMISVVRAGESSGRLPEALAEIRKYLEWVDKLVKDVRQASIYPCILVLVLTMFITLLFAFVIPKFVGLLQATNVPLPLLTIVVIEISHVAQRVWPVVLAALFLGPVAVGLAYRHSRAFAFLYDLWKLQLPVFGELHRMVALARFCNTLGSLTRAGIPILNALDLCREVGDNRVLEQAVLGMRQAIEAGENMSSGMRKHRIFSNLLVRMVAVGETTGRLDEVLNTVGAYYEDIIPRRIKQVFSIVEPSIVMCLIFVVGTVALSVFLPLMALMDSMR